MTFQQTLEDRYGLGISQFHTETTKTKLIKKGAYIQFLLKDLVSDKFKIKSPTSR